MRAVVLKIAAGGLALACAACASSPPAHFYALSTAIPPATESRSPAVSVVLGPFELPEYLNRPQIVTRRSGNEMNLAELHRWAEPLEQGFLATLAADLRNTSGSAEIYQFPLPAAVPYAQRVTGRVRQFEADGSGIAHLVVQWVIQDRDGKPIGPPHQSRYQAKISAPDDYGAVAAAMSDTVQQFAAEIALVLTGP